MSYDSITGHMIARGGQIVSEFMFKKGMKENLDEAFNLAAEVYTAMMLARPPKPAPSIPTGPVKVGGYDLAEDGSRL